MIIVQIIGGLGNQIFQYAFGKSLELKHNIEVKYDIYSFETYFRKYELDLFNINPSFASREEIDKLVDYNLQQTEYVKNLPKFITKIINTYYKQQNSSCNPEFFKIKDNMYLEGYWQSDRYFSKIEDTIRKDFTLKEEMKGENKELSEEISTKNSVSLHIRRGDYIIDSPILQICSLEYYQDAINTIMDKVDNPHFYIFSDEPQWAAKNLQITSDFTIVKNNLDSNQYMDMILMSYCKHNIIANSSFSWWGAWLNNNPDKIVIAPKNWTSTEMYSPYRTPKNWLRIQNEWVKNPDFIMP